MSGLPSGLSFSADTLTLSGTPSSDSYSTVTVTAKNAAGYEFSRIFHIGVGNYTIPAEDDLAAARDNDPHGRYLAQIDINILISKV